MYFTNTISINRLVQFMSFSRSMNQVVNYETCWSGSVFQCLDCEIHIISWRNSDHPSTAIFQLLRIEYNRLHRYDQITLTRRNNFRIATTEFFKKYI
ncbi:hypothetical protein MXB_4140, partial [Myxobolus squamalis]